MWVDLARYVRTTLTLFVTLVILTGLIYPFIVTQLAQLLFPWRANGSLILQNNKVIGSALIGQEFTGLNYFWGRESATMPFPYTANASAGSNFGPSNPEHYAQIRYRVNTLHMADLSNVALIPADLVTASASGLDPDISPAAAYYQVHRIAQARRIPEADVRHLIGSLIQKPWAGVLGEPRINVLQLNLALDGIQTGGQNAR